MIRNEFFRRVITRCAASSLACAASERKFRSRGSFSKYSTRQGAQSVSNSFFGNSSMRISQSVLLQGKLQASHSWRVNLSVAKSSHQFHSGGARASRVLVIASLRPRTLKFFLPTNYTHL